MKNIVVLISGNGSNLQAIIDSINSGHLNIRISLVISNKKSAFGLERAKKANIPVLILTLKSYIDNGKTRCEYDTDLAKIIKKHNPNLIILAGFMHILSQEFIINFPKCIINIHPALPGKFDGCRAIERAYEAYKLGLIKYTGVMIHYVNNKIDKGEVIDQKEVEIYETDSIEDLKERIHLQEHKLLIKVLNCAQTCKFF